MSTLFQSIAAGVAALFGAVTPSWAAKPTSWLLLLTSERSALSKAASAAWKTSIDAREHQPALADAASTLSRFLHSGRSLEAAAESLGKGVGDFKNITNAVLDLRRARYYALSGMESLSEGPVSASVVPVFGAAPSGGWLLP